MQFFLIKYSNKSNNFSVVVVAAVVVEYEVWRD
jgi:hypothetical protein